MKKIYLFFLLLICISPIKIVGQTLNAGDGNKLFISTKRPLTQKGIIIPKVDDYTILTADLHMHSVFSDGDVWPVFRVEEAFAEGIDVISITDHIEYRPNKKYLPEDLNLTYKIAKDRAHELGIILIPGCEITRKQGQIGHFNALFVSDVNKIKVDDPKEAITIAYKQGSFITFNHPGWAVDSCKITPFQEDILNSKMIKGIEVANHNEFYPVVLDWAIDRNLTVISASDAHAPIVTEYPEHRPLTLLFTKESTPKGVRDALNNGLTLGYTDRTFFGRKELLEKFFRATISFKKEHSDEKVDFFTINNKCSFPFIIKIGKAIYTIEPLSSIPLSFPKTKSSVEIMVLNMQYRQFTNPTFELKL
jgi:3',5'-nucleoside bisphosphate phosphatase